MNLEKWVSGLGPWGGWDGSEGIHQHMEAGETFRLKAPTNGSPRDTSPVWEGFGVVFSFLGDCKS